MTHWEDATVSLGKFDSSLGTLTGVHIEFTTALYGANYQFDNDGSSEIDVNPTLTLDVTDFFTTELNLNGTGISTDGRDFFLTAFTLMTLQPNDGDVVRRFNTGGVDYGQWVPDALSATTSGDVASEDIAEYIGTGNFDSTVNPSISLEYTTSTDVMTDLTAPTGTFTATVVYEYVAVPEPAAMGLLGLGGILTLAISRFRRRNH